MSSSGSVFASCHDTGSMDLQSIVDRDIRLTERALEKAAIAAPPRSLLHKVAEDFVTMARAYYSDAKHFREKGELDKALATVNYAHGWLDAGARLGLLDVCGGDLLRIPEDRFRRHYRADHGEQEVRFDGEGSYLRVARRARLEPQVHSADRRRDDVAKTRAALDLRLVSDGHQFVSGDLRAERIVEREGRAHGRGRTHSESLRHGQACLAQDLDFAGPVTEDLLRDPPGDVRPLAAAVDNHVDGCAGVVPDPRHRADAEAQAQPGAPRAFLPGIRILTDLEERGDMPGAERLTLGHHGGWPATPARPRAPSILRTSPSDPCGRRS